MKKLLLVHLWVALFCFPFLTVYCLDGVRAGHRDWFTRNDARQEYSRAVTSNTPEAIARELEDRHGIRGEYTDYGEPEAFHIERNLVGYEVEKSPTNGVVRIKEARRDVIGSVSFLHVTAGLEKTWFPNRLWGVMVVLVSVGLIVLGLSGLFLWIPRLKERRAGLVFLTISLAYALGCLAMIFLA